MLCSPLPPSGRTQSIPDQVRITNASHDFSFLRFGARERRAAPQAAGRDTRLKTVHSALLRTAQFANSVHD